MFDFAAWETAWVAALQGAIIWGTALGVFCAVISAAVLTHD